jgi:imidazole glycerol-phosphate synthase subunit HisH
MYDTAVIDYGVGNLLSVRRGLEHCGASVEVTADHKAILTAPRVILPGVGAFANAMKELRRQGLDEVVLDIVSRGTPLLGICLGMQMLLDESEEFGKTEGLGLIPGSVVPIPSTTMDDQPQKIPHIGWNSLLLPKGFENWDNNILQEVYPNESVYFVHSFMAIPSNPEHSIANCLYGGIQITATIERNNVYGCQFHPEKSGEVGLKVLKQFLLL